MQGVELIETWRILLERSSKPWVLFENGTCVVLDAPGTDLVLEAQNILRELGPVGPSEAGDFGVAKLKGRPGWVVAYHHPNIGTLVGPDEVSAIAHEVEIGLCGRSKRETDAAGLRVLHIEPTGGDSRIVRRRWSTWRILTRWLVRQDRV